MDQHKKDHKKKESQEDDLKIDKKVHAQDLLNEKEVPGETNTANVQDEDTTKEEAEDRTEDSDVELEDGSLGSETAGEDPEVEEVTEQAKTVEIEEEEMLFTRRKIKNLQDENRKLSNELDTLKDRMLRISAEYENFRNRTAREKEEIESDVIAKVLSDILPVMDNLERALIAETDDLPGLKDGVQMTLDQFVLAMKKMGVELIPTDTGFDPEYHEAVIHEMDAEKGEKEVAEVFLKGYKKGDKVVRHSVVKVVN